MSFLLEINVLIPILILEEVTDMINILIIYSYMISEKV
jgi:hypothetical protein